VSLELLTLARWGTTSSLVLLHLYLIYRTLRLMFQAVPQLRRFDRTDLLLTLTPKLLELRTGMHDNLAWVARAALVLQSWGVISALMAPFSALTTFVGIASPSVVLLLIYWPKIEHMQRHEALRELRSHLLELLDRKGPLDISSIEAAMQTAGKVHPDWPARNVLMRLRKDDLVHFMDRDHYRITESGHAIAGLMKGLREQH